MVEVLPVLAFLSSVVSAVAGIGGGILLVGVMALYLPPQVAIPIHGVVQLFSNLSRALFLRHHIAWRYMKEFVGGALLGALLGLIFEPQLSKQSFMLLLGAFILIITWLPIKSIIAHLPGRFFSAGCLQVYLSLFVGATGPVSSALLVHEKIKHQAYVGTNATLMSCIHFFKIAVFLWLGFSFYEYILLTLAMVAASVAGSWVGSKITPCISERWSKPLVKLLLTVLSLRLLYSVLN